ncbi:MAG: FAD-dependent oxidoreductase, partial [Proteobacteria bacterium]|nr:FAD-dependent oxidoreductase [Pseudomonadota bacterium]
MIRRTFLKTLMAGAGASAIDSSVLAADAARKGKRRRARANGRKVVIGGAGITGLCCGYELMNAGFDVTILEASGRYGGHVFTGSDGLSDGLYADFGADHITKPGYERLLEYAAEFGIQPVPYPNAEGAWLPYNDDDLRMVGGKAYTNRMLADPATLARLGFNGREARFLSKNPWYELQSLYLGRYVERMRDPYHPFGIGLDELDKVPIEAIYRQEGASQAALQYLGGQHTSALYSIWRLAAKRSRGIPPSEGEMFRLKGGNEQLPIAFAKRLGSRVKLAHPLVVAGEDRKHRLDRIADAVIVGCHGLPLDPAVRQRGARQHGDDGRLGFQQRAGRFQAPLRGVHHRHRVFHRDRLEAAGLHVQLGAAQAWQDDRLARQDQVRAVELGGDMHHQVEPGHAGEGSLRVGHRHRQVAAEADQRLRAAVADRLHRLHRIVAVGARRGKAEALADAIQQRAIRFLGDADGAVALHVGVAAQRADAGAFAADVAAQQQQVGQLLHVFGAMAMLGDAHAVAHDHALGLGVDQRRRLDLGAGEAGLALDRRPRGGAQIRRQRLEAGGVRGDEVSIELAAAAGGKVRRVEVEQAFHDALEHCQIAAHLNLVIG